MRLRSGSPRKTKIIATLGPASWTEDRIRELITSGVNLFRFNFSHGSQEQHLSVLQRVRLASEQLGIPVAALQDLAGPKIRISNVEGDYLPIDDGATVMLRRSAGELSNGSALYVEKLTPQEFLEPGHQILLADGIIELRAREVRKDGVLCEITKGGRMRSRVGIAFPDSEINLPATTEKDMLDLSWAIEHQLDYVAISFVNDADDVERLRTEINKNKSGIKIIAKIERKSALSNIDRILDVSDGVMVARGDLGLELPLEKLPGFQKHLIEEANFRGIPVIVATQMLHSMISSVRPTRAEVSDIATAVMSGADALMLSEETAIGENPILAVEHLDRIAREAECEFDFDSFRPRLRNSDQASIPDAVAYAAAAAAVKVKAEAVIACTETGTSARLIAKYRPQQPLFGASSSEKTLRRMCLYWGVIPVLCKTTVTHHDELDASLEAIQRLFSFEKGKRAVITGGLNVRTPGSTSVMEIREFGIDSRI